MRKLQVHDGLLFEVKPSKPSRLRSHKHKHKSKKVSRRKLKQSRHRWRVTYQLRKRGVRIETNQRHIYIAEFPVAEPVRGWLLELKEKNGYSVQFTF